MNDIQRGVITLIKSAITGQAMKLPDGFSMEAAFPLIKEHQVIPIAYEGAVLCGISRKTPIMRQMLQAYCQCALISEAQMDMAGRIFEAFEQNEIDYMPVKGCNMKALFPKPELRQMGDADILIRVEQYDRIKPIVAGLGFSESEENDHELVWHCDQLHLELHKCLIPPTSRDFCAYFGDGWRLARKTEGSRYNMSAEDEYLFNFTHYAKHYRGGGIGCRHILDLWVYRRVHTELDEQYILDAVEKLRMREFYENTCNLVRFWFEDQEGDDKAEFMSEFIFNSGSWGKMKDHILSRELRNAKSAGSLKGGKRKTILQTLFPSASKLKERYTVLKKCPWLLPVVWPVRWVDVLLFRRGDLRSRSAALKMATEEQVETYQQSLNYVGLDFHYEE